MAVAVAKVTGADHVQGNKKVKVRTLTFSSNYATGGEALAASAVGLKTIDSVTFHGPAVSTDLATANECLYNHATGKVLQYESGASGAAIAEKTNSEAYATGSNVRATFVGH